MESPLGVFVIPEALTQISLEQGKKAGNFFLAEHKT